MQASRYYKWVLRSYKHKEAFKDWLIDNGFDVYGDASLIRGEVIAFNGRGGRGSLFETGYANKQCMTQIHKYMRLNK